MTKAALRGSRLPLAGWAVAAWLAAAPAAAGASDVQVEATLTPEVVGVGERVTLVIEVSSGGLGSLRFTPDFALENLEQVGGPYTSREARFVSGEFSRTVRLTWRLRPLGTGWARVHDLRVRLGEDEVLELPSRTIQVQAEPVGREDPAPQDPFDRLFGNLPFGRRTLPRPQPRGPVVFMEAEATPERPYVGQQVLYSVYLYTRGDISAIQPRSLPEFQGFWVRDIPQPEHLTPEWVEVDGERYGRVPLMRKALFPLRPGEHLLEPAEMEVVVRGTDQRFFGPRFTTAEQVDLATRPVRIVVEPLPPAPAGFEGAVGRLSLTAKLAPHDLRMGEAATLTVTLSGRGNLEGVAEPALAPPPGVEVLPPQQGAESELDGTVVHGERSWSYAVVPKRPGRYRLEVADVSYFDPATGAYQVAAAPPLELVATRAPVAAAAPGAAAGLHTIRSAALPPGRSLGLHGLTPWLFALPWALALVVTLARRRAAAAPAPPGSGGARHRLEHRLERAGAEPRARQAAAEVEAAWREFLAERWGLPPDAPSSHWVERLAAAGAEPQAAAELAELAADLHYLRHAPQLSAAESLQSEAVERSRRLLRRLR